MSKRITIIVSDQILKLINQEKSKLTLEKHDKNISQTFAVISLIKKGSKESKK